MRFNVKPFPRFSESPLGRCTFDASQISLQTLISLSFTIHTENVFTIYRVLRKISVELGAETSARMVMVVTFQQIFIAIVIHFLWSAGMDRKVLTNLKNFTSKNRRTVNKLIFFLISHIIKKVFLTEGRLRFRGVRKRKSENSLNFPRN